jgi:hypothetical protein
MNSRQLLFVLTLLLITYQAGPSAHAQGRTSATTLFTAPVTVSGGIEDVAAADGGVNAEPSISISPIRPELMRTNQRSGFRLTYSPEVQFVRSGGRNLTFWNHAVDFALTHTLGRRTKFDAGHSYLRSSDPARLFADNLFVLPRNNFRENATAISVNHSFTRTTTLGLRFDNTITRITARDLPDLTFLSQYGVVGSVSLSRQLDERQKLTGTYSLLKFSPYRFTTLDDATNFLSSLPSVRAGLSRYAVTLAMSSAAASSGPAGVAGGNIIGGGSSRFGDPDISEVPGPLVGFTPQPRNTVSPSGDTALLGDPFHSAALSYSFTRARNLTFAVTGGVMADDNASYIVGVHAERRYDRFWISGMIQHYISNYGSMPIEGIPPDPAFAPRPTAGRSTFSAGTFVVGANLTRNTEVEIFTTIAESKANFVDHHVRSVIARGRLNHWFNDRVGIFATADNFSEDRMETGGGLSDRQRFFAGLQFRLGRVLRRTRGEE